MLYEVITDIAVSVSVNYQTGSPRSLSLMLEDTLTHNTYGIQTYVVYGHGTKKISFIPKNNPPESSNFRWVITLSQRDKLETIVNEQKYTYPVEVSSKVYAHSIRINSASLLLDSAETVPLTVTFFPEETNYTYIQWHSSDTSIVKVNEKGRLSAIAKGMARITSYNVCYTKLLRLVWAEILDDAGGAHGFARLAVIAAVQDQPVMGMQLEFMVSLDPYINETTRHADLILPPPRPWSPTTTTWSYNFV